MRARALYLSVLTGSIILASLLTIAVPVQAYAQQEAPVVAGIAIHVGLPKTVDTVVYQRSISRAGKDTTAGTRTVVSKVVNGSNNTQLLEVEQRFPAGNGEIVDTAIAEARTLRAVAHRSHQPTRIMRFDFLENSAKGTLTQLPAAVDSAVNQAIGGPIFDSNVIDLVVASLPLEVGLSTQLPFFIFERGGRVVMPVSVRERATVAFPKLGDRDAWVINVGVPGAPATIWVDAKTRAVLRTRYDVAARGVSFIDDRITPLRL
jgi:hypothetical protein